MYEEFFGHFGLQRNPFHVSPDPLGFYSTAAHDEALSQLVFGIETHRGMMILTGEPGTGKSTIVHYLREWLQQQEYSTAYIFHPLLASVDLLKLILRDFGIPCSSTSKSDLLIALKGWLQDRHAVGDCPVILIDEAQGLSSRALDELRMLVNMEIAGTILVQVLLAGQPLLEEKLRRRKLAQLRQRIMCLCRLPVLTLAETSGYIASRLAGAGVVNSALFPKDSIQEIFLYSHGVPRVVNLLCEHALLTAYADRRDSIVPRDIVRVARHFDLGGETESPGEVFQSNTFCRLIPFPKLGATVRASRTPEQGQQPLPTLAPEPATAAPDPILLLPTPMEKSLAKMSAVPIAPTGLPVISFRSRMVAYCRAVGSSLLRDSRHLVKHTVTWLGARPQPTAWNSAARLRKLYVSSSSWLRMPLGSPHIAAEHPRVSAATHKHF